MLQERKRMQARDSISATGSEAGGASGNETGGGDSVYAAIVRLISQTFRRTKRFLRRVLYLRYS